VTRDFIAEQALIDISRAQRRAWEFLLINAGIAPEEAFRIADLASKDREAVETREAA
jgi:hypothetical protein